MALKDLLETAKTNLRDLTPVPNPDFRLEQARFDGEDKVWDVVVSYLVENTTRRNPTTISALVNADPQFERVYKRLTIDKDNNVTGFYIYGKG